MSEVTVLIPAYNSAKYLTDTIHSLIGGETSLGYMPGQDYTDIDIIILDDGSTDNTEEVCSKLALEDMRVRHIHYKKNEGKSSVLNKGMDASVTDFVTVLDADDMREEHSIRLLYETQKINPHSFVYDDIMIFGNGKRIKGWKFPEYDFVKCLYENQIHTGIMFPRSKQIRYPAIMRDGREDWAINVLLGSKGYCGIRVDYAGYLYRREEQNRTLRNVDEASRQKFFMQMQQIYPDLYAGRFPMGCCGGRTNVDFAVNDGTPMTLAVEKLVGSPGMSLVEYIGGNDGTETIFGPVTGTAYRYGRSRSKFYADNRDLHTNNMRGLLDIREKMHSLFKLAPVEEVEEAPAEKTVVAPEMPMGMSATSEMEVAPSELYEKFGSAKFYDTLVAADLTAETIREMTLDQLYLATGLSKSLCSTILKSLKTQE